MLILVDKNKMLDVFWVFVTASGGHAWGCAFETQVINSSS